MGHLKMTFTQTRFVHASSSHHQHYQHSKSALEYLSPNNIIGTRSPSCGDNTPVRLLPASDYVSKLMILPLKSGPTRTMSFDMKEDRDAEEEAQA
jgi:hypothetical protein